MAQLMQTEDAEVLAKIHYVASLHVKNLINLHSSCPASHTLHQVMHMQSYNYDKQLQLSCKRILRCVGGEMLLQQGSGDAGVINALWISSKVATSCL